MITSDAPCGLKYAVSKSGSSVAYCAVSVRCGTSDEGAYRSGIAHFVEHTVFKGTSRHGVSWINSRLEKLGGELNAFTTKEEIVFHATVLKEDLPKAVDLLMELVSCPSFPDKEVEMEKGVVIEEIKSYKDSPADDVYDKFEEMLFEGCPLGRPILGTAASVRKISGAELRRFVAENFTPDRMALSIVSNEEESKLSSLCLKKAAKWFGEESRHGIGFKAGEEPAEALNAGAAQFDVTMDKRNHEVNAVLGGVAPSLYMERRRIAALLLCNILGGPASNSLLNASLREKHGWVYGVECAYTQYRDTGAVAISLGCDKCNLELCFEEIWRIIRKLQEAPLSPVALKAAKKQFEGQLAISSDNGETQCLSMGKSLLAYGRVASSQENRAALESVTAEEIQQAALEIFNPSATSRLIFL